MMNRKWKQVIAFALTLVMLVGMLPTTSLRAYAAEGEGTENTVADTENSSTTEEEQEGGSEEQEENIMLLSTDVTGPYEVGGVYYAALDEAITAAGSSGQINLVSDAELTAGTYTIPSGVSLVVPYAAGAETIESSETMLYANSAKTSADASSAALTLADKSTCTYLLTIGEGVIINVEGLLAVGGVLSGASGGFSGQTYGSYSMIDLDGTIVVKSGGVLSCCGYIVGSDSGSVVVENGGEVYEPFVVCDYNGGTYTVIAYMKNSGSISPFNRYAMFNIQVDMVLEPGAVLQGYVSLLTGAFAGITEAQHNESVCTVIGPIGINALLNADQATIHIEYTRGEISSLEEVGHTHLTVTSGTVSFGELELVVNVAGRHEVSTATIEFPVPYNFSFKFQSGTKAKVPSSYALRMLPGTEIYIAEDAEMVVEGSLALYSGLNNSGFPKAPSVTTVYPTSETLQNAGYSARARLIVDGTLYLKGSFAGLIESKKETGVIKTEGNEKFGGTFEDGLTENDSYTDLVPSNYDNYTCQTIGAQVWNGTNLVDLVADENYYACDYTTSHFATGFDYTDSNGNTITVTFEDEEEIKGAWMTEGTISYAYNGEEHLVGSYEPGQAVSVSAPPNITAPTGYTLVWDEAPTTMGRQNYVLEAEEVAIEYSIYYNLNNGKWPDGVESISTYTVEDTFTLPTPIRSGYTFTGWTGSNGETEEKTVTVAVGTTGTLNYIAHWEIEGYGVTFDADGGSFEDGTAEQSVSANYQDTVYSPSVAPEKEGYTFAGWYKEDGTECSFPIMVTGSITVYAKWTINSYTIQFYQNYGSNNLVGEITETYGVTVNQSEFPADPVRENYIFTGWYTTADCSGVPVTEVTVPADDIEIFAGWKAKSITVTFLANGGEGEMDAQTICYTGGLTDLSANEFERTGYRFTGWNTAADGSGTNYSESASFYGNEADLTLYAQWTANTYTVTLDANGGSCSVAYITVSYDGTYSKLPTPTRTGYDFDGWYTDATDGVEVKKTDVVTSEGNITLYAQWTTGNYEVTWDANGGSFAGGDAIKTESYAYGEPISAPEAEPVREGYIFNGWNGYSDGVTMGAGDVTYKAQWEACTYTVVLDANGGTFDGGSATTTVTVEHGGTFPYLPYPTCAGYAFVGWFLNQTDEDPIEQGDMVSLNQDATLTAKWDANLYTITYKDADTLGTLYSKSYATGAPIEDYIPTKPGYTFSSWDKTIPATMPADNIVFYASWTENVYTVIWVIDGTEIVEDFWQYGWPLDYTYSTPEKNGYTFAGWKADDGSIVTLPMPMPDGNLILTATWNPIEYTITWMVDGKTYATTYCNCGEVIQLPQEPSKDGYIFAGWDGYTENDVMGTANATYNAKWTANKYTVTWIVDGAETVETYGCGDDINIPADPTKTGYTFAGWDTEIPSTMPAENVTIKAKWTINQYTITFNTAGGSAVDAIKQDYGTSVTAPADPTKTGYTFAGWDTEIPSTMPAEDVTITAQWTINQYTITFDTTGGSAIDAITQDYGTTVTAPADPTKTGYTFAGWDTEIPSTMPAEDVTIKAKWTINQYTITFDTAGGSAIDAITQNYGTSVTKPADPTKSGYTFAGWDTEIPSTIPAEDVTITAQWTIDQYTITFDTAGGSAVDAIKQDYGTSVTAPANPTKTGYTFAGWDKAIPSTMPAENVTITAKWSINQYTITFNTAGGSEIAAITQNYGTDVTAPAAPTKAGYTFAGWDTEIPSTMPAENLTITAKWTINQYTITFDTAGGSEIAAITQNYGTDVTAPADPTKTGYTFVGWDKEIPSTMPAENVTVTAQWTINSYTITWIVDGVTYQTDTYVYGAATTTPDAPTKDGHTFAGWDAAIPSVMPAKNLTFTAQWTVGKYTVTWVATSTTYATYNYGEVIEVPVDPTKTGYTFTGWDGYKEGDTMGAANVTFTAQWKINSYTVTWVVDGAKTEVSYNYGATISAPVSPAKTGYTFAGWDGYVEGTKMGTSDLTYTAKWTVNQYTVAWIVDGAVYQTDTYDYGAAITAPEPVKAGYNFGGWTPAVADTMPAENLTITAKWNINQYTITFDTAGGSAIDAITQDYGTTVTAPADPTKTGYTFAGWDKTIPSTMPAENLTITAKWTINQYTITFDTAGGSKIAEITQNYSTAVTAPADPTKTGYTFDGWDKTIPSTMPAENVTITAQWSINQYTIAFDTAGGSAIDAITQDYGTSVTEPADPTKTGYTFAGWDKSIPSTMPAENVTIKAQWTINQYTITFDTAGGSAIDAITQNYGASVTEPADPTKTGYTFDGWDKEIPSTMPAENLTITAQWTINQYTITFNTDGGSEVASIKQDYGTAVTAPADPTKTGYTFAGWDKSIPSTMPAENVTIKAQWTINQYTITFDTVDGSAIDAITQDYGTSVTEPADPTKTGYTFAGWDKEIPSTMPAENLTITAQWTINQYTITFNTDGGFEVASIKQDYGTAVTAPADPTKTGYTFDGWDTEIPSTMPAENVTITAQWTINQYTITFNTDGGSEIAAITQDYGTSVTAPADPTKTGYTFAGWDKAIPSTMPAENVTIKAQWTINQYTITFDTAGGSAVDAITQNYGTAVTAPADPTKTGYTFDGWDKTIPNTMSAENVTITAQWTINQYTITFNTDGGSEVASIKQDYGTAVTAPADPTKTGYTFAGWDKAIPSTMPAENVTTKAQWTINQYTITFDTAGGSAIDAITQNYGTAVTAPADPTKTGYTFAGWDKTIPGTMPAENLTITAKWTINSYTVTWDVDGEKTEKTYTYGATVKVPANPTKTGYTFIGWSPEVETTMGASNVTYTAQWKVKQFTIYFNSNGGSNVTAIEGDYNSVIENAPSATKEGYILEAWCADSALTNEVVFPYTIQTGAVLYAKWKADTYSITFDANGGSFADGSTSKTVDFLFGDTITTPDDPSKINYVFDGWLQALPETMPAQNLTVYAQWTAKRVTITFETGCDDITVNPIEGNGGDSVTLPNIANTRPGYRFDGWTVNGAIVTSPYMPSEDATYTAKWTSYLDLLVAIQATNLSDDDTLALAREYYDLMQKDATLLSEYKNKHSEHLAAMISAILNAVEKSVVAGATSIKEKGLLLGEDNQEIATLVVNAENRILEICIEDPNAGAITLVTREFLPELLGNKDIAGVRFEDLYEAQEDKSLYEYWGITTGSQMDLMYRVAFAALRDNEEFLAAAKDVGVTSNPLSYDEFLNVLTIDMKVGIMDGSTIRLTALIDTEEEFVFPDNSDEIAYTIHVYTRSHNAIWMVDGEVYQTDAYELDKAISLPMTNPSKEGYTFRCWLDAEGNEVTNPGVMGKTDVTYTADWTLNQQTVNWMVDGSIYKSVSYNYNEVITTPANPTKTGYTFVSWAGYEENTLMPDETLAYNAVWNANTYTVTFKANGGAGEDKVQSFSYDEAKTLEINVFTRTGYTFSGWNTMANGAGTNYGDGESVKNLSSAENGNVVLYAQWTANTYTVTLDANGGTVSTKTVSVTYDSVYPQLPTPTREGYRFAGWTLNEAQVDGAKVTVTDNSQVLVAQWTTGDNYIITYNRDGGVFTESVTTSYDVSSPAITLPTPVKTGYTFAGWTGTGLSEPTVTVTIPTGSTGDREYTATWSVNSYKVTWDTDGGALAAGVAAEQTYEYGAVIVAPTANKEGHTFDSWNGYTSDMTMPAEDVTFTAVWNANSYTVTWNVNGGTLATGVDAEQTYTYGETIAAPIVSKVGHTFEGWDGYTDEMTMPAKNVSFTAVWSVKTHTVTWNVDGVKTEVTYAYGDTIKLPDAPTKEGHIFKGWDPAVVNTMPDSNLTYTAVWETNEYTVTWDVDGKTETETYYYGMTVHAPESPTKTGYTFAGWDGYKEGDTMGAANVTFTAQWKINCYTVTWIVDGTKTEVSYDYGATISAPVSPAKTGYTFAGWDGYVEGTKMGTSDLTYTAKWTVNQYSVAWIVDGAVYQTDTYDYGAAITAPTPTKDGYVFGSWTPAVASTMPAQTLFYTATWNVAGDTAYTVYHYQQKLNGSDYELVKTENLTGATESEVFATWQIYTGFVANADKSTDTGVITGDGKLELKLYYDRKTYTVTWVMKDTVKETYRYGAALNVPNASYNTDNATYTFTGWKETLASTVTADVIYTALYSVSYDAVNVTTGTTYRTIELALANAKSGDLVRLEKDATLAANATVPAGVTLLLPCKDDDTGYEKKDTGILFNPDGTSTAGATGVGPYAKLYRTLTIPEGVTLVVNGTVMVNAITGRPATSTFDQDVTGGYAQIQLEGEIIVNSGGTLDSFGYVKGDGQLTVENGGTVGDLFIVRNWRGGSQGQAMYNVGVYPMNESDCHNIEADIMVKYGGIYTGLVKMYASNKYWFTRFPQVDVANGLIRLTETDGYVLRSYQNGREIYRIYGGAEFSESTLTVTGITLSTKAFMYPIDGDIDFILMDGKYTFVHDFKFIPGASMTAEWNADIFVNADSKVVFYKEFNDLDNVGTTEYPSGRPQAVLTLEAGSTFTNNGTFAGKIVTCEANVYVKQGYYIDPGKYASTKDDITYYTPIWDATMREANGYYNEIASGEKTYVTIDVELEIERKGYTWRFGDTSKGEENGSIIWINNQGLSAAVANATAGTSSTSVKVTVFNTYTTKKTVNAYVVGYNADGKMVGMTTVSNWSVAAGTNGVSKTVTVSGSNIDHVKVFLLDGNWVPLADSAYAYAQ